MKMYSTQKIASVERRRMQLKCNKSTQFRLNMPKSVQCSRDKINWLDNRPRLQVR